MLPTRKRCELSSGLRAETLRQYHAGLSEELRDCHPGSRLFQICPHGWLWGWLFAQHWAEKWGELVIEKKIYRDRLASSMHDCWIKMQSCSVPASYWSLKVVNVTSTRDSSSPITALNGITNKESFLVLFCCLLISVDFWLSWSLIKLQVGRKDGTLTLHSGESARWLSFSFQSRFFWFITVWIAI